MCFSFKKQRRLPRKRQIYYCIYNGKHWSAEMEIDGIESQACFSNWGLRTLGGMWGWEGEGWTRGHPGVAKLNITDNAQSHSHIAAHKCWDSGPLLILPALHPFPLLGNDNSPSTYSLGKAGTKAPARAQAGPETLSVESGAKNSLLERFVSPAPWEGCPLGPATWIPEAALDLTHSEAFFRSTVNSGSYVTSFQ